MVEYGGHQIETKGKYRTLLPTRQYLLEVQNRRL